MAFMQWFKCYADLKDHPKRWRFEELAETEFGLHYITAWFSYVCKFAPAGDVTAFTAKEVARACEWKGDPQKLWDALRGAGFIDATENGWEAHDWHEENGRFIRENERRKPPTGYPRVTHGLPVLQDKTGQDKTVTLKTASSEAEFEQFWSSYPRRVGKGNALKAWLKLKPPLGACLATLAWQKRSEDWTKDGAKFVPHPTTWLNRSGWLDENPDAHKSNFAPPRKPVQVM